MSEKRLIEAILEEIAFSRPAKRYELVVPRGVKISAPCQVLSETETVRTLSFNDKLGLEYAVMEVIIGRGGKNVPYISVHELFGREYRAHRSYYFDIKKSLMVYK